MHRYFLRVSILSKAKYIRELYTGLVKSWTRPESNLIFCNMHLYPIPGVRKVTIFLKLGRILPKEESRIFKFTPTVYHQNGLRYWWDVISPEAQLQALVREKKQFFPQIFWNDFAMKGSRLSDSNWYPIYCKIYGHYATITNLIHLQEVLYN